MYLNTLYTMHYKISILLFTSNLLVYNNEVPIELSQLRIRRP